MAKLNTDGTSKINKVAGCRGFVSDHLGVWRIDFSKFLGLCNALLAELWGVFEGFKLTKSLGLRRVEVNMDSTLVIMAIEEGTIDINCVAILRSIKQLINDHEVVIVSNTYRDSNKCSDGESWMHDKNFFYF
ncbi:uncharacterized protein LOC131658447 [Vicia villosa]|uniref:uncharacterized protein LOC131658447 n=1 Tax=Vicia villosa TaxID=3911 RepID=UPI00273AC251|nr:uncharacterized protein LOC131658447 [Vicia villosa]